MYKKRIYFLSLLRRDERENYFNISRYTLVFEFLQNQCSYSVTIQPYLSGFSPYCMAVTSS
jgi:hypothetical protein